MTPSDGSIRNHHVWVYFVVNFERNLSLKPSSNETLNFTEISSRSSSMDFGGAASYDANGTSSTGDVDGVITSAGGSGISNGWNRPSTTLST